MGNHRKKAAHPKWHNLSCHEALLRLKATTKLLQKDPKNAWLRGKLNTERKHYKSIVKKSQNTFLNSLFNQLDSYQQSDPKKYMDIVRSLRNGSYDSVQKDDSSGVPPDTWKEHFTNLLGKVIPPTAEQVMQDDYVNNFGPHASKPELDGIISKAELIAAIKKLKNNKASSFDKINNEMLKVSAGILSDAVLTHFNAVLNFGIFPASWKSGILQILHKSGTKSDPNHFRGICVSSCFGKLFNKILRARLELYCDKNNFINKAQLGGQAKARTADHLLVIKFLFDKYVKVGGNNLYACFYDLKKAFDSVNRTKLFYNLLTQYGIGGNFIKILRNLYTDNKIFVQTAMGLIEPFNTTVGVLQGDILSPNLFNLFVGKTPDVIDSSCDPVSIGANKSSCLLWCDDLVVFSKTPGGLQIAINKIATHFSELGLEVNKSKTKVLISNKRGLALSDSYSFYLNGENLEIVKEYQYLGLKL